MDKFGFYFSSAFFYVSYFFYVLLQRFGLINEKKLKEKLDEKLFNVSLKYHHNQEEILNDDSDNDKEAFWKACKSGNYKKVKLLLNKGVNPDIRSDDGETPLIWVSTENPSKYYKIAELLIKYKADINACDAYGTTPLIEACNGGNYYVAKLLIKKGADVNKTCESRGIRPLKLVRNIVKSNVRHEDTEERHKDIEELLLKHGAVD